MICRRLARTIVDNAVKKDVVWFGSYGVNEDGTAKFFNLTNKHDNFSNDVDAIADSLTQKLNILRGELWWNISYGLPLLQKISSKLEIDASIAEIVLKQDDVRLISYFESSFENHVYQATLKIDSEFGSFDLVL